MGLMDALDEFSVAFADQFAPRLAHRLEKQEEQDQATIASNIAAIKKARADRIAQTKADRKIRNQAMQLQDELGAPDGTAGSIYQRLKNGEKISDIRSELISDLESGRISSVAGVTGYNLPAESTGGSVGSSGGPYVTSGLDTTGFGKTKKNVAGFLGVDKTARNQRIQDAIDAAVGGGTSSTSSSSASTVKADTASGAVTEVNQDKNKEDVVSDSEQYKPGIKYDLSPKFKLSEELGDAKNLNDVLAVQASAQAFAEKNNSTYEEMFTEEERSIVSGQIANYLIPDIMGDDKFKVTELVTKKPTVLEAYKLVMENWDISQTTIPPKFKNNQIIIDAVNNAKTTVLTQINDALKGYGIGQDTEQLANFEDIKYISEVIGNATKLEDIQEIMSVAKEFGIDEKSPAYKALKVAETQFKENASAFDNWPSNLKAPTNSVDYANYETQILREYKVNTLEEFNLEYPEAAKRLETIKTLFDAEQLEQKIDKGASETLLQSVKKGIIRANGGEPLTTSQLTEVEKIVKNIQDVASLQTIKDYQKLGIDTPMGMDVAIMIARENGQDEIVKQLEVLKSEKDVRDDADRTPQKAFEQDQTKIEQDKLDLLLEQGVITQEEYTKRMTDIPLIVSQMWNSMSKAPDLSKFVNMLKDDASNLDLVVQAMIDEGVSADQIEEFKKSSSDIATKDAEFWRDPTRVTSSNWVRAEKLAREAGETITADLIKQQFDPPFDATDINNWTAQNIATVALIIEREATLVDPTNIEEISRYNQLKQEVNAFVMNTLSENERKLMALRAMGLNEEQIANVVSTRFKYIKDSDGIFWKHDLAKQTVTPLKFGIDETNGTDVNELDPNSPEIVIMEQNEGEVNIGPLEVIPNNTDDLEETEGSSSLPDSASVQGGLGAFGTSGWLTNSWNVIMDSVGMQKFMSKSFNDLATTLETDRVLFLTNMQSQLPGRESKYMAQELEKLTVSAKALSVGWVKAKSQFQQAIQMIDIQLKEDARAGSAVNINNRPVMNDQEKAELRKIGANLRRIKDNYQEVLNQMNKVEEYGRGAGNSGERAENDDNNNNVSDYSVNE